MLNFKMTGWAKRMPSRLMTFSITIKVSVVILNVIMLSVIMLSVIMLSVIMLSVVVLKAMNK